MPLTDAKVSVRFPNCAALEQRDLTLLIFGTVEAGRIELVSFPSVEMISVKRTTLLLWKTIFPAASSSVAGCVPAL